MGLALNSKRCNLRSRVLFCLAHYIIDYILAGRAGLSLRRLTATISQKELLCAFTKACLSHAKTSPLLRLKPWLTNSPNIITSAGGSIKKREYWGLRALSYRIKNRKGHYIMFNMETGPEALKEYERLLGLNEDVLRF